MKYGGILCVLLASLLVSREYCRHMNKRISECREFLAFISHMRVQVGCFLRPVRELGIGFSSETLEEVGFIEALSESENIKEAYLKCEPKLSLSMEEKEALFGFFSSFGDGYLDEQVKLIDSAYPKIEKLYLKLSDERVKNTRLVSTVSVTLALGFIIFVI